MPYLAPTTATAKALFARGIEGPVVMLNLLRFRDWADYAHAPQLAPPEPITGRAAYARYKTGLVPLLEASGGRVLFAGDSGDWFIGPEDESWDHVLLVRQTSVSHFLAFADDPAAREIGHHRTAALADSRLLPLRPSRSPERLQEHTRYF